MDTDGFKNIVEWILRKKGQDYILRNNKITTKVKPEFSDFLKNPDDYRYFKFLSVLVLEIKDRNYYPLHHILKQKQKDSIIEEKYKDGSLRLISILKEEFRHLNN